MALPELNFQIIHVFAVIVAPDRVVFFIETVEVIDSVVCYFILVVVVERIVA